MVSPPPTKMELDGGFGGPGLRGLGRRKPSPPRPFARHLPSNFGAACCRRDERRICPGRPLGWEQSADFSAGGHVQRESG